MTGKLYLIGTPIGNLGDISPRAADTLGGVDFIAAEDTRVTLKLLNHLGIKRPLVSYHEHNRIESGEKIVARLLNGETCALVTDAGMPAISDPGEALVALCAEAGIPVFVVPGPSAVVAALALSGLPSGRFTFEGFLSTAKKSRFAHLDALRDERRTMVFYEAPHKLRATLEDMLTYWGDRRIAIAREITKLHEETLRTTLSDAVRHYGEHPPRGEFVLVIEGAPPETEETRPSMEEALQILGTLRAEGKTLKDAARACAALTGYSKNTLYDAALQSERATEQQKAGQPQ